MARVRWLLPLLLVSCATAPPKVVSKGLDWDEIYRRGADYSPGPNALLISAIQGRTPGAALDLATGQGRNAVFLASHGWSVTGVDLSQEGLRLANQNAAQAGLSITTVQQDIDQFDLGTERYDLVTLIYAGGGHLAPRIDAALKPGGLVVVEFFHTDMRSRWKRLIGAFETGELERRFKGYRVIRSEVVEDVADWWGPSKAKLVRFIAQKP